MYDFIEINVYSILILSNLKPKDTQFSMIYDKETTLHLRSRIHMAFVYEKQT